MRYYALDTSARGDAETDAEHEEGWRKGDVASCPACGATIGMLAWLPPLCAELKLFGNHFGDFAFIRGSDDFLVSQKFRGVYYAQRLTGLVGFDPVQVVKVRSRRKLTSEPPMYFRVSANYGQTALDLAVSGFEWLEQPTCRECWSAHIVRWKCLKLKEGTWTGEDAFRPRGKPRQIMVSQRFKDACGLYGIKNAVFVPAEISGYDFYKGMETTKFKAPQ